MSILVPAYNAEPWIARTLRSAVGQTWQRKEIVVVDDGSGDGTLREAKKFEEYGVRVATHQNQGAARTRNRLLSLSQGDYIQWLDADDLLAPDKIKRQIDALPSADPRVLLSGEWAPFLYRERTARFQPTALWADQSPLEWMLHKMGEGLYMQTSTWLVSREVCDAAGPWDERLTLDDDGEYFCRVLRASSMVKFVPGAKVYYRQSGPSGLSGAGGSSPKLESQWLSMQMHVEYLREAEDSERVRAACVNYLQLWLPYFHPYRPDIIDAANQLARELGGTLRAPEMSRKFKRIESMFGTGIAEKICSRLLALRWSLANARDKALFRMEQHSPSSR